MRPDFNGDKGSSRCLLGYDIVYWCGK